MNCNNRPAKGISNAALLGIFILIVVSAIGYQDGFFSNGKTQSILNNTNSQTTNAAGGQGVSCASTAAWQVKQTEQPYGGDALAGTVDMAGYQVGTQNVGWSDLTSTTSPATSSGTYAPSGQYLLTYTETSTVLTYPIQALFQATGIVPSSGTVIDRMDGFPVLTLQCAPSSSNSAANLWNLIATPPQAPTSGASATTDAKELCIWSNGNSPTSNTTAFPTTSTLLTCNLDIMQAYRGAGYNIPIYGSQQNPVTDYATGATTYSGSVNRQLVAIVFAGSTAIQAQLDPSAQGLSMRADTSNLLASGTKAWIVTGFTGCAPVSSAASSSSPVACESLPIDMYANTHTGDMNVQVMFTDMQDVNYVLQNLVDGSTWASNASATTGSVGGSCGAYSSGLTPTSGNDAGTPAPLIDQCYEMVGT